VTKKLQLFDERGNEIPLPEDGVIRDGQRGRIRMTMQDGTSAPRLFALDGGPPGQRPGAILDREPSRIDADFAAVDAAHTAHEVWLRDAHRGGKPPEPPPASLDAAYALHETNMHLALRGGVR
jgi:hypothetical protein